VSPIFSIYDQNNKIAFFCAKSHFEKKYAILFPIPGAAVIALRQE
jgi:hypothetical protein